VSAPRYHPQSKIPSVDLPVQRSPVDHLFSPSWLWPVVQQLSESLSATLRSVWLSSSLVVSSSALQCLLSTHHILLHTHPPPLSPIGRSLMSLICLKCLTDPTGSLSFDSCGVLESNMLLANKGSDSRDFRHFSSPARGVAVHMQLAEIKLLADHLNKGRQQQCRRGIALYDSPEKFLLRISSCHHIH
jgi:hypothetical protein